MSVDIENLRKLAQSLKNKGNWKVQHPHSGLRGLEVADSSGLEQICADVTKERAEFVAAANPLAVIELLDMIEAFREIGNTPIGFVSTATIFSIKNGISGFIAPERSNYFCTPVYIVPPNKPDPLEPPQPQCDEQYRLCTLITGIVVGAVSALVIVGIWWWL